MTASRWLTERASRSNARGFRRVQQIRQQRGEIPRQVHDPQDQTIGMLGIVDEQIIEALDSPETKPRWQQLEATVSKQGAAGHSLCRLGHRQGKSIGKGWAGGARR